MGAAVPAGDEDTHLVAPRGLRLGQRFEVILNPSLDGEIVFVNVNDTHCGQAF